MSKKISKKENLKDQRGRPQKLRTIKKNFKISLAKLEEEPYKIFNFPNITFYISFIFKMNSKYPKPIEVIEPKFLPEKQSFLNENLIEVDETKKDQMLFFLLVFYSLSSVSSLYQEIYDFLLKSMKIFVIHSNNREEKLWNHFKSQRKWVEDSMFQELVECLETLDNLYTFNFKNEN